MFLKTLARFAVGAFAAAVLAFTPNAATAQSGNPITIGFAMSLTGPLAANGKQALLGMQIWEEEINAKGGLLGRPVKLVYYDDQTNPSTIPGIYTKLHAEQRLLAVGGERTGQRHGEADGDRIAALGGRNIRRKREHRGGERADGKTRECFQEHPSPSHSRPFAAFLPE